MNLLMAWKKVLLFGLFGAVGCLAGWLVGEVYLAIAEAAAPSGSGRAPSLINKPVAPSTEPPPPPREFKDRLDAAGAKTGDVQISLIWFDENDLDLHCVDPSGFEICWKPGQRYSPRSRGELDVDRNAGCREKSPEPVENIYWAKGTAPQGKYKVYLDFYQRCEPRGPDESTYRINVLHGGERKEFSGTIRKETLGAGGGSMKLIYEFQLRPQLELFAPKEFEIIPGNTTALKVPVAVRRDFYQGKIEVKAEGLPENVTAETLTLRSNQSEGDLLIRASDSAVPGKLKIKLVATGDDVSNSVDPELTVVRPLAQVSLWAVVSTGLWTALLAVGLSLALVVGQNYHLKKPLFTSGRVPLVVILLGAAAAGFASGTVGQLLYSLFLWASNSLGFIGQMFGWTLLGGLLGWGVSFFIPNLERKKAVLAGLAGGVLGGLAFAIMSSVAGAIVPWVYVAGMFGRFGGAALLGFCIGLMVAIVETAFRRAWLEVRFSEREVITVNLGPEPVKVGGDSRACTVWARGAAAIALRYWIRDGKVHCEDVPTKREATVGDGDSRAAGNVMVVVRTASGPAHAAPAPAAPRATMPKPALPAPPAMPTVVPVPVPVPQPLPLPPPPAPAKPQAAQPSAPAPAKSAAPPAPAPPKPVVPAKPQAAAPMPAPPAPKPPAPAAPKPPVPAPAAKPPVPAAPATPPAPAAPASGAKADSASACPTCGRALPGKPGSRYCMVCDRTF